jgi:heptosyltransferase I
MRILLIKTSSMGDVIHTLPALTDAKKKIADISFDWVVEEGFAEIPRWHMAVQQVIPVALRRWRKHLLATWQRSRQEFSAFVKRLRAVNYDYIIDAQGLCKSAFIAMLARGAGSSGYDYHAARESLAALFYRYKFAVATDQHAILRTRLLLAQALGYSLDAQELAVVDYGIKNNIFDGHGEDKNVSFEAKAAPVAAPMQNVTCAASSVMFIHGSSRAEKCWDEARWVELAHLFNAHGVAVLLPWGNDAELQRARRIASAAPNVQVLPAQNITALARMMQQASGVIAVDTGLAHLAAALEVPTLALYGATVPARIGVVGKRVAHLVDMQNLAAQKVWSRFVEIGKTE